MPCPIRSQCHSRMLSLSFQCRVRVTSRHIGGTHVTSMSHSCLVSHIRATPQSLTSARQICSFKRLGHITLQSNQQSNYRARELKTVDISAHAVYLKLLVHPCHPCPYNRYNQVGLIAISVLGSGAGPSPVVDQVPLREIRPPGLEAQVRPACGEALGGPRARRVCVWEGRLTGARAVRSRHRNVFVVKTARKTGGD